VQVSISFDMYSGVVSTAVPPEENSPHAFLTSFQDSGWKSGKQMPLSGMLKSRISLPVKEMCLYS